MQQLFQEAMVGAMAVALMMSVGLDLTTERIKAVWERPGIVLLGLGLNHLLVPGVTVLLLMVVPLGSGMTNAVLLCATAAAGPVGAYLTQQARGNLPVAASLLVTANFTNLVLTPLSMALLADQSTGKVPALGMAKTVFLFMLAPLVTGIVLRCYREGFAVGFLVHLKRISNVTLGLVLITLAVLHGSKASMFTPQVVGITFALATLPFILGSIVAPPGARLAMSLVTGTRNLSMGFLLAIAWFPDPITQLGALLYASCMYIVGTAITLTAMFRARGGPQPGLEG